MSKLVPGLPARLAPGQARDKVSLNPKQRLALRLLADLRYIFYLFYGGSRSGKTYLAVRYIRIRCLRYPGSRHLIARLSFATLKKTIWLQTILPEFRKDEKAGLCKINKSEGIIQYTNGAMVVCGGLEPHTIDRVLAAEYGTIFITEANENSWDQVENLVSRLNDTSKRASDGAAIPLRFICDLNPTVKTNWTFRLFIEGVNPASGEPVANRNKYVHVHFKPADNAENLAAGYLDQLGSLSPAKRKRFFEGEYGTYEGLVYQCFDERRHIVDAFEIPADWPRGRAIDFGFVHPFVCLWSAFDPAHELVYFYREYVLTRQTVAHHATEIKRLSLPDLTEKERKSREAWKLAERLYRFTACDHDIGDQAVLQAAGLDTKNAYKEVLTGLDHCIDLFQADRVRIFRTCTSLITGIQTYRWRERSMQGRRVKDREVIKEDDDETDAMRYLLMEWFPHSIGTAQIHVPAAVRAARHTKATHGQQILQRRRRNLERLGIKT